MSNQMNLLSITTRNDEPGGESIKEKDATIFSKEIEGIMELTRIENGQLNKVDYESLTEKTVKMILKNKKDAKVNKIYTRYENIWRAFVLYNNIMEGYDDVALVRFFKSIQSRYSPNTLWVVYSCLNSRLINEFGVNLKGLPASTNSSRTKRNYILQVSQRPMTQMKLIRF